MDNELKTKWVAALRSGEFQQGQQMLHIADDNKHSYCCLGVLCKVMGAEYIEWFNPDDPEDEGWLNRPVLDGKNLADDEELNTTALNMIGITKSEQDHLVRMNDGHTDPYMKKHTFEEIAEHIEKNL
jgi:hypothetical protein